MTIILREVKAFNLYIWIAEIDGVEITRAFSEKGLRLILANNNRYRTMPIALESWY